MHGYDMIVESHPSDRQRNNRVEQRRILGFFRDDGGKTDRKGGGKICEVETLVPMGDEATTTQRVVQPQEQLEL